MGRVTTSKTGRWTKAEPGSLTVGRALRLVDGSPRRQRRLLQNEPIVVYTSLSEQEAPERSNTRKTRGSGLGTEARSLD